MNRYGLSLLNTGNYKRAIDLFQQVLAVDPLNAEARNDIGLVYADENGSTTRSAGSARRSRPIPPS